MKKDKRIWILVGLIIMVMITLNNNNKKEEGCPTNTSGIPTIIFRISDLNYDINSAIAYLDANYQDKTILLNRYGYYSTEEIKCNQANNRGYFYACVPSYQNINMVGDRIPGSGNMLGWASGPFISNDKSKILIAKSSRIGYDNIGNYQIVTVNIYNLNYGNYNSVENIRNSTNPIMEYYTYIDDIPELPQAYKDYFNANPNVKSVFDSTFTFFRTYGTDNMLNYFIDYINQLEATGTLTAPTTCLNKYDKDNNGVIDSGYDAMFDYGMCVSNSENQKELHKLMAAHVAYSIWLDKNNKLPWKLNDYNQEQLQLIINNRAANYWEIINDDPTFVYNFNKQLVGSDQLNTIANVLDDARYGRNGLPGFMHTYIGDSIPNEGITYKFLTTNSAVDSKYNSRSIGGCGKMSIYLKDSLLALNIPAKIDRGYFYAGHTSLFMPYYGILFHGDDIYSGYITEITAPNYLMSYSYFNSKIKPCGTNVACLNKESEDWVNYINPNYKTETCTMPTTRECVAGNGCYGTEVCNTNGYFSGCYTNLQACPDSTCSTNCGGTPGTPCSWQGQSINVGQTKCVGTTKATCVATGQLDLQYNSNYCSSPPVNPPGNTNTTTTGTFDIMNPIAIGTMNIPLSYLIIGGTVLLMFVMMGRKK